MSSWEDYSILCRDNTFGPTVPAESQCRGGFDFTVTFEEGVLSLAPACLFIAIIPWRLYYLSKQNCKVKDSWEPKVKLLGFAALCALQAALLSSFSKIQTTHRAILILSATFQLLASILLTALSYCEYRNTIRPSFLLSAFLLLTTALDAARARTQSLIPGQSSVAGILIATAGLKLILILSETRGKASILLPEYSNISSELRSGLLSRAFFTWLFPVLYLGFKSVISSQDLPSINEKLVSQALMTRVETRWNKRTSIGALSLLIDVLLSFPKELCIVIVSSLVQVGLNICQPFLVQNLVTFLESPDLSPNLGYGLLGAFFCVSMTNSLVIPWGFHYSSRLMIMARGALVSMIYSKLLRLKGNNANPMTAFTLVTADVETIVSDSWRLLEPWANLLQIIIGTYLLYRQLGAVCCVPVIVILLTFTLVALVGSRIPGNQGAWFQAVERRIDLTSQTLESLHQVKLLGLSRFLENRIQTKRRDELNISKKFRVTNCLALASAYCPQSLAPLITFGAYSIMKMISSESNFSVSTAVMSFSILNLISNPAMQLLLTIPMGAQAIGCYGRIQNFLQISESPKSEIPHMDGSSLSDATGDQERKQPLKEAVDKNISAVTLSLQLEPGRIIAITGPSGCGKSLVLRQLISNGGGQHQHPDLSHPGGVAYCSQTPWIFQGTIRDNIVGQSELDNAWYQCVIRSCELDVDLDRMPQGDDTDVGSQGSKLSGGQRQRCAIARALYSKKKRVIFDDVTSALDGHTLSALTNNLFGEHGILRSHGISAVVATHSVPLLRLVDQVLLMNEYGQVINSGSYEELVKRQEYFSHHQTAKYSPPSSKHDEALQTRELETSRGEYEARMLTRVDDLRRKKGDWSSFTYYLSSMGWLGFFIFVAGTSLYIVLNALSGVWLVWWAEDTAGSHDLGYWLGLYATWAVLITLGMLLTPIFFFTKLAYKASDILHSEMLITALRAPISVLAKTEDTGSLVNRFSQDIRLCDWQLPFNILLTLMALLVCLASIGIAISAVPYVAIGTPVLVIVLYFLQMLYLRTSRQLRLLEIEQKAPIVSLFLDTIQGMVAIHAFGWSFAYIQKNLSLLDMSQKPYYLLFCVQRWLILVLALIATGMEIVVIGVAVALRNRVSAGLVGLAVVHVTTLGKSLSDLVMQWTEMETSLGAVSRIYRFTRETSREGQPSQGLLTLPEGWPLSGSVTFESVSATYDTQTHDTPSLALSDITFTIKAGEKVGICGRTGSGKSSLMASLMGLLPCHQGRIFIDGTDISMIAPEIIRCKVNFVTQDPFIFDGTIRENLSPWDNQVADNPMVQALVKVGLWKKVASLGGLDAMAVSHCFSLGERQLFCLARSLLRNSTILILDEPTGHIDPTTDATIQQVIRQEFLGQTVIMIAHRLRSLIDFDTVIVLESGHIREIGSPRPLLRDPASAFSGLYHAIESVSDSL